MPGIFDILYANGILNSLFGGGAQPPTPSKAGMTDTGDDTQRMLQKQNAILSGAGSVTNPVEAPQEAPTPLMIQAMENGGVPPQPAFATTPAETGLRVPSTMPASAMGVPSTDFSPTNQPAGFGNVLTEIGKALSIAGSKDPSATLAAFQEMSDKSKPKFVPIPGTPGGWLVYPDGRQQFIQDSKLATWLENNSESKLLKQLLLIKERANAEVDASGRKEAGKELVKTAGDTAATNLAVNELDRIANSLEKTDTATGPVIGLVPKWGRDIVTPEGAALQDDAERIIQASLRQTLGAQFTEKEGKRFLERAYNPRLDEKTNAARLRQVGKELFDIQNNKEAALEYMKKKGTLDGFVPPQSPMPGRSSGNDGSSSGSTSGPARVSSEAEWAKLPSGTQYIGPDGKTRTKR